MATDGLGRSRGHSNFRPDHLHRARVHGSTVPLLLRPRVVSPRIEGLALRIQPVWVERMGQQAVVVPSRHAQSPFNWPLHGPSGPFVQPRLRGELHLWVQQPLRRPPRLYSSLETQANAHGSAAPRFFSEAWAERPC